MAKLTQNLDSEWLFWHKIWILKGGMALLRKLDAVKVLRDN
jgi:hypothetical protein